MAIKKLDAIVGMLDLICNSIRDVRQSLEAVCDKEHEAYIKAQKGECESRL